MTPAALMLAVLDEVQRLHRPPGTLLIVNDRLDVALAGGAMGCTWGRTIHALATRLQLARISSAYPPTTKAQVGGPADGVTTSASGPIFATASKRNPGSHSWRGAAARSAPTQMCRWWRSAVLRGYKLVAAGARACSGDRSGSKSKGAGIRAAAANGAEQFRRRTRASG